MTDVFLPQSGTQRIAELSGPDGPEQYRSDAAACTPGRGAASARDATADIGAVSFARRAGQLNASLDLMEWVSSDGLPSSRPR